MRLMGLSSITPVKDTGRSLLGYVLVQGGSVMRTENWVVLASPELRMARTTSIQMQIYEQDNTP